MSAFLPAFCDAIQAAIRATLPGVAVETHGGTFTEAELARYSKRAPIAVLALIGFSKVTRANDGRVILPTRWALVLIAKDQIRGGARIERGAAAAAMAAAMTVALEGRRFATAGARQPQELMAQNEYSGDVDKVGVAIWQVAWTSPLKVGEMVEPDAFGLTDFGAIEASAIAALSDIWINGAPLAEAEVLDAATMSPDAALLANYQPDGSV